MSLSDPTYRVAFLVSCAGVLFGFGISSIAGVLDVLAATFSLDTAAKETLVSSLVLACFAGALAAGPLTRVWGRRPVIFLAAGLAVVGYAAILAFPVYAALFTARLVLGFSVGLSSMAVPMYAAEATSAHRRGAVVALFQLAITAGILLAYAVSLAFVQVWPWSWVFGVGVLPAVLYVAGIAALPESPRWLRARGRHDQARQAATVLNLLDEWDASGHEHVPGCTVGAPGKRSSMAAVLVFCSALFILQNLSGIDGILYYAPHIFQTLGFAPGTAALAATFGLGLVNFVATVVALRVVDTAGRRPLLIGGSSVMVLGLALVVAASLLGWSWVGLAGLCLFIAAFAVSLGPMPYVLMSELFPSAVRERGIAIASAVSWLFNALIAFTFLSLVDLIGLAASIGLFCLVCALSWLICVMYLPETRRVRLEDIEANVMAGKPLRRLGDKE